MTVTRHPGPVEVGQVWTCRDNDGKLGYRRVRVLAAHPDGGWILEDLPSRSSKRLGDHGGPFVCPDVNLRIVFVPEEDDNTVLGHCPHGVDLDREFCHEGCRL